MSERRKIPYDSTEPLSNGNAIFAAELAYLSYLPKPEIEKRLATIGYPTTNIILFFDHPLLTAFILRWDDVTVIAIKGTSNWREWFNNLNVWPKLTDHGRIHAGYLYTINQLGPALLALITPDLARGSKIVLTGHSRGGALGG